VGFTESVLIVAWLVVLEALLSADNALVLAMMVRKLPKAQQKKALTYGIWGAFCFRIIAVLCAVWLIKFWQFKLLGGAYLLHVAVQGLKDEKKDGNAPIASFFAQRFSGAKSAFWFTVLQVEMMDIAFSVDSILAAVAITNVKLLVILGGMLGILTMRYVAGRVIVLLEKYPTFSKTAYVLVFIIGVKLLLSIKWHPPEWLTFGLLGAVLVGSFVIEQYKRSRRAKT
jgi:YkoY family integral membrane protein